MFMSRWVGGGGFVVGVFFVCLFVCLFSLGGGGLHAVPRQMLATRKTY